MSYPIMSTMPISMAKGLKKTPNFNSTGQKNAAGMGNSYVSLKPYPTWDFEFDLDHVTGNEAAATSVVSEFLSIYMQCNGQTGLFLFTDPQDNTVTNMSFGTGDGTTVAFQLSRTIGGSAIDVIQNPNVITNIKVNGVTKTAGVDYSVSSTGVITFASAPANSAALTWTGSFYFLCRFDADTVDSTRSFTINSGTDQWMFNGIKFSSEFVTGSAGSVQAGSIPATGTVVVTGTPSAGQVLTATSSIAADWQTPAGADWINALNLGAKADGSTDNYSAIQTWVNNLSSSAVLYFPTGTFNFATAVTLNKYVQAIRGDGVASSTLQVPNSSATNSIFVSSATANEIAIGFTIEGICFNGPGQNASSTATGVVISNQSTNAVSLPRIINCKFSNWPSYAFDLEIPILGILDSIDIVSCGRGYKINSGTSTNARAVYINNVLKQGHDWSGHSYWTMSGCGADNPGIGYLIRGGGSTLKMSGCGSEVGTPLNLTVTNTVSNGTTATVTYSGADQSAEYFTGMTIQVTGTSNGSGALNGRKVITSVGTNTVSFASAASFSSASDSGTCSFFPGDNFQFISRTCDVIDAVYASGGGSNPGGIGLLIGGTSTLMNVKGYNCSNSATYDLYLGSLSSKILLENNNFSGGDYLGASEVETLSNGTRYMNAARITDAQFNGIPWIDITVWGGKGDASTDNTTPLNNAVAAAYAAGVNTIYFPNGTYYFGSKPADIPYGLNLVCQHSKGAAFGYGAVLCKNYVESTATNGFLTWSGANGGTAGNGGGIEGFLIWQLGTNTGGTTLKFTGTTSTARSGLLKVSHVRVSGDDTWNKNIIIDGSAITTSGTQGIRDVIIEDSFFFNSVDSDQSIYINNGAHVYLSNVLVNTGAGSSTGITVTGSASGSPPSLSTSQNIYFSNVEITGDLVLDYVNDFVGSNVYISGNYSSTSNTTTSKLGGIVVGSITNNGGVSLYLQNEISLQGTISSSGTIQATSGAVVAGSAPSNITAGDVSAASATTGGTLKLGSDGNCLIRRNNGSGSGTNLALTFDGFSTTPFQLDTTNGLTLAGAASVGGLITAKANIHLGVAGTTSGVVTLEGSASGSCTITSPATAGTTTNPIAFSNAISLPAGTALSWNADTGISRSSAAVLYVGNGTAGDASGTVSCAVVNAGTGFRASGAATSGNVLRGNGTNFVSATLAAADLSNGVTGSGAVALAGSPTFTTQLTTANLLLTGTITEYDGINTSLGGVCPVVASALLQSQTANVGSTSLIAASHTPANGMVRVSVQVVLITAATTGSATSTLPTPQITFQERYSNTSQTITLVALNNASPTANVAGTTLSYGCNISIRSASAVSFATTGYASNTAAQMAFTIIVNAEYFGG